MHNIELKKYYYPQLDAIRGLSFIAIFFYHAYNPTLFSGFIQHLYHRLDLSIDVFFVLSSFLLTWLGINEIKINNNFSFKNYFARRALRIWPLYFILLVFSFIALPFVAHYFKTNITLPPPSYYIFFIANFYNGEQVYFLKFLWTLSVEEQFYILWGGCLWLLKRSLLWCVIFFLGASISFSIYALYFQKSYFNNTLTYFFDFGIGALTAILLYKNFDKCKKYFHKISWLKIMVFYFSLPLFFYLSYKTLNTLSGINYDLINLLVRYFFIIFTALVIVEQMSNDRTFLKLANSRFLIYTGKISYGLYCFHGIVLTFGGIVLQKLGFQLFSFTSAILFLVINYIIASLSYQFIEKPFLRLKDKLRRI